MTRRLFADDSVAAQLEVDRNGDFVADHR